MDNLIRMPQAKTHWKNQVLRLILYFVAVCSLFVTCAWFGIPTFSKSPDVSSEFIGSQIIPTTQRTIDCHQDTKIPKLKMENQNADIKSLIAKREQFNVETKSQIIVCYYTIPKVVNSSLELDPSELDPDICTHIIVGFASVVNSSINLGDASWIYASVARLKNRKPGLKVMLSVAGMDEVQRGFPPMVETHANRKRFIRSVLELTKIFNLDGLDVDWEFPGWPRTDVRQKIHFVQLLQELRKGFDRCGRNLLLSIAVAAPAAIVDQSYNIPEIARHVDFVCLMSYDYHFYVWYFPTTGHNAPLYPRSDETGYIKTLNVNYSAMYWLAKGMPREKLVIGIPTYGHSYELDNPLNHALLAPAKGFGKLGINGFVSYTSVCSFLKFGATRRFDRESEVPYAYKYNEWVSYEDTDSVQQKAEWIKTNGFAGAMVFSLNADDWNASCDGTKADENFPLTRTIVKVLREISLNGT